MENLDMNQNVVQGAPVSLPSAEHKALPAPRKAKKTSIFGLIFWFVIFYIITFVAINFSAYWQIANYYYAEWNGTNTQEMQVLVKKAKEDKIEKVQVETKKLPVTEVANIVPKLEMEVTPPDNRIVIPKINKNAPIVEADETLLEQKKWDELNEHIEEQLHGGVVHYPHTAKPYEYGNVFLTGHSSYYAWDKGSYKDIFALLYVLQPDDEFMIYYEGRKYVYRVSEKLEVDPDEVEAMRQGGKRKIATLMTCTPPGTNLRRLLVIAELISES